MPKIITHVGDRKVMFENEMTEAVGLIATCNSCDRIIFEDENDREAYVKDERGYCKECRQDSDGADSTVASGKEIGVDENKFE